MVDAVKLLKNIRSIKKEQKDARSSAIDNEIVEKTREIFQNDITLSKSHCIIDTSVYIPNESSESLIKHSKATLLPVLTSFDAGCLSNNACDEKLVPRLLSFYRPNQSEDASSIGTIDVTILEDPSAVFSAGTGATLWDCSIILTKHLIDVLSTSFQPNQGIVPVSTEISNTVESNLGNNTLKNDPNHHCSCNILELGAGLGLPSIVLAKAGYRCIASERDLMINLLQKNIERNFTRFESNLEPQLESTDSPRYCYHDSSSKGSVDIIQLDWKQYDVEKIRQLEIDIVVGADLFFPANKEVWIDIADIYNHILSSNPFARGYLAHEPRNSILERDFFKLLDSRLIHYERQYPKGCPPDIHIYSLTKWDES